VGVVVLSGWGTVEARGANQGGVAGPESQGLKEFGQPSSSLTAWREIFRTRDKKGRLLGDNRILLREGM